MGTLNPQTELPRIHGFVFPEAFGSFGVSYLFPETPTLWADGYATDVGIVDYH